MMMNSKGREGQASGGIVGKLYTTFVVEVYLLLSICRMGQFLMEMRNATEYKAVEIVKLAMQQG